MRLVIIESPFAGTFRTCEKKKCAICSTVRFLDALTLGQWRRRRRNLRYLRAAMRDCLIRGEAPFASHALYTQPGVLSDMDKAERWHGIQAGFAWAERADARVLYQDLGMSEGMQHGIKHANSIGQAVEFRSLRRWRRGETKPVSLWIPSVIGMALILGLVLLFLWGELR